MNSLDCEEMREQGTWKQKKRKQKLPNWWQWIIRNRRKNSSDEDIVSQRGGEWLSHSYLLLYHTLVKVHREILEEIQPRNLSQTFFPPSHLWRGHPVSPKRPSIIMKDVKTLSSLITDKKMVLRCKISWTFSGLGINNGEEGEERTTIRIGKQLWKNQIQNSAFPGSGKEMKMQVMYSQWMTVRLFHWSA